MSSTVETIQDTSTSSETENLTGHVYDGIQEYDNPLPGWWTFLFWVSILFAPVYFFYFHSGVEGRSIHEQYTQHMASVFELRFKKIGDLTGDRETLLKYMNDEPEWLAVGEAVFKTNCVSCHGADGSGEVGPNLTDDHWKHVNQIEDIVKVIEEGAANGAMPAWKNRLSHQNQVVLTAAYVAAMRKSPIAGKKGPEGRVIPGWDEPPKE